MNRSPNFTGYHVCVVSADMTYAYPGFYPTAADFGFAGRTVQSVRKGCWTATKFQPTPAKAGRIYRSPEWSDESQQI